MYLSSHPSKLGSKRQLLVFVFVRATAVYDLPNRGMAMSLGCERQPHKYHDSEGKVCIAYYFVWWGCSTSIIGPHDIGERKDTE